MKMCLLVFITKKLDSIDPILSDMLAQGISGATVLDAKGMLKTLHESDLDPPPIFGSLRQFINPESESVKMLVVVLDDSKTQAVRALIRRHAGDLTQPNTGILFEVPVNHIEGVLDFK